jgi:hypothetical protein
VRPSLLHFFVYFSKCGVCAVSLQSCAAYTAANPLGMNLTPVIAMLIAQAFVGGVVSAYSRKEQAYAATPRGLLGTPGGVPPGSEVAVPGGSIYASLLLVTVHSDVLPVVQFL